MPNLSGKINIVFVVWTLQGMAGSERVVYDIVRKLNKDTYLATLVSLEDGPIRSSYEDLGVQVYVVSKQNRIDPKMISKFRRLLLSRDANIVNAHHFSPYFYAFLATRLTNIKLVYTEHSQWQLEQLNPLKKILHRILLKKTDAIIAISKQIEEYYLNTLSLQKERLHLITNGIDWIRFQKSNCESVREEIGIKPHEKVVGMVGNFRPEKNHKLLISAFSRVAKELKDIRLLLVGIDCMQGEIHRFVAKSDVAHKIVILGQRDDVPALLSILDVFCLPSMYEGLPITVLEAMAAAVPVIGSDVIGINEVINHDVNGLLFPKNDEKTLVKYLKKMLTDSKLKMRLAKEAMQLVKDNYCIDHKIREYDLLFRGLYFRKSSVYEHIV